MKRPIRLADFNPRTPRGVRHVMACPLPFSHAISIHAPREGCDRRLDDGCLYGRQISIHAPREGCDPHCWAIAFAKPDFNPRTPRGVRPFLSRCYGCYPKFQSTHPARGATICGASPYPVKCISIHAPREGCDFSFLLNLEVGEKFQSTHPARGATVGLPDIVSSPVRFQSTHPARGATKLR